MNLIEYDKKYVNVTNIILLIALHFLNLLKNCN